MSCHTTGKKTLQPHVWMDEDRESPTEEKYSSTNGSFIQTHCSFIAFVLEHSGLNVSGYISD